MILHNFKIHLETLSSSSDVERRLADPLAQISLLNTIKQLNMIKTVFETEGLLGWTDEFNNYCARILDFVNAEKFYIFTCT